MTYRRNEPSRRDRWKAKVLKTPTLSHGTRLFLVHCLAKHMKADGFVSRPRHKLAAEAGVSERQVARYTANAVSAGWLVLVGGGFRTMTSEYQAVFPDYLKGDNRVTQSEPEKGDANKHPFGVTIASPFLAEKGDASRHPTSSSTTRPSVVASAQSASSAPGRCAFAFGLGTHGRDASANPSCRTVARTVERHRPRTMDAAQVETNPSGTDPATPFDCLKTRPRAEVRPMTNPRAAIQDATTRRAG